MISNKWFQIFEGGTADQRKEKAIYRKTNEGDCYGQETWSPKLEKTKEWVVTYEKGQKGKPIDRIANWGDYCAPVG